MRAADDAAFREVFVARVRPLRRTAYLLCGDWHRAEDLVQVAFLKLYGSWSRVRHREAIDGYLRTVLVRAYVDETRRPSRREHPVAELPDGVTPVADDGPRAELLTALRAVPPRQRACLVLRYFDDLSVSDTAAALGCSEGTVKSQTAKGLVALRGVLDQTAAMTQES